MSWFALLVGLTLAPGAWAWEITRFDTRVTLHEDATATVTETIIADFNGESRHGIYRDIPIHYTDRAGQHFTLRLRIEEVTDGAGRPWPYRLESSGRSRRVRIGDADRVVTDRQTYRLVYTVWRGAVRFFPDHDECYWNLTGNEWAVPIRFVQAELELPAAATDVRSLAYVGSYGSQQPLPPSQEDVQRIRFELPQGVGPYEGLTAVVGWAKGAVQPPTAGQVVRWWLQDHWIYGIPLLVLACMSWLWAAKGRDPRMCESHVVRYEPPSGLTPAEAGTLMDQRADLRDITATVIDLAMRGYLRIEPVGKDYRLVSLKPWKGDAALKAHEHDLCTGIFGASETTKLLSELEHVFYDKLPQLRDDLYMQLVGAGLLDKHPDHVRRRYWVGSLVIGGGIFWVSGMTAAWHQMPPVPRLISAVLSGLIVLWMGHLMPRRTLKGAKATNDLFGFVEFVKRADADRIRRLNDPSLFERGLPYALAFGVAAKWARAFEGLYRQPPTWYAGSWDTFSARRLGSDLTHTFSSMNRTLTSQPRSSGSSGSWGGSGFGGGGFSGGGGGGGGGGAW